MSTAIIASHLRRRYRLLSSITSTIYRPPITSSQHHLTTNSTSPPPQPPSSTPYCNKLHFPPPLYLNLNSFSPFRHSYHSTSSTSDDDGGEESSVFGELGLDYDELETVTTDGTSLGFTDGAESLANEAVASTASSGADSIPPVRLLINLLDGFHDFTGWPWWVIIASTTLAFRSAIFPVLILQLRKLERIVKLLPKLPPPFPPPLSGRSYINQLSLFQKEKRAIGCPSFLWVLASLSVQVPCFLLLMTTVRRMSLDNHPGFDCGGILWFQNLTEIPHGVVGLLFPLLISTLHLTNVQISFLGSSVGRDTGTLGSLAYYYKMYLRLLTLPIFLAGISIPQGCLVYWLTNSTFTIIQQVAIKTLAVQKKFRLPDKEASVAAISSEKSDSLATQSTDASKQQRKISIKTLKPQELLAVSVKYLSDGHRDRAIPLLKLALDKDPDYVKALITMGQVLLQKELMAEATDYFERAISKLYLNGDLTEVENCDLLILAYQWAGVAYIRQNKQLEGIEHLEKMANLDEPEDLKSKAHYFDGLLLLASALYNGGRKDEAIKHLRRAAAYDSSYNEYLEQAEKDDEDFLKDIVGSRRSD